jgi:hypothetical protein
MLAKIAVETERSPGIGRKCGERGGWIRAREVDAVVAQEHPAAVCRVGVAGQVRSRDRGDFHTPAEAGLPCREALPDNGRVLQTDRQQVDVRRSRTCRAVGDRSVDVQRCPGFANNRDPRQS